MIFILTLQIEIALPSFHILLLHLADLFKSLYLDVHDIAFLSFPGHLSHATVWGSPLLPVPYCHPEFCPKPTFSVCIDLNSHIYPKLCLWQLSFTLVYQIGYVHLNYTLNNLIKTNKFTTELSFLSSGISTLLLLLVSVNGSNHLCHKHGNYCK